MAFITRVRLEGAGESPDAIRAVLDTAQKTLEDDYEVAPITRIVDEVFERASYSGADWYKGRRVVWFVEPGGANDPNAGKA
jgi:hypothetical protein